MISLYGVDQLLQYKFVSSFDTYDSVKFEPDASVFPCFSGSNFYMHMTDYDRYVLESDWTSSQVSVDCNMLQQGRNRLIIGLYED